MDVSFRRDKVKDYWWSQEKETAAAWAGGREECKGDGVRGILELGRDRGNSGSDSAAG